MRTRKRQCVDDENSLSCSMKTQFLRLLVLANVQSLASTANMGVTTRSGARVIASFAGNTSTKKSSKPTANKRKKSVTTTNVATASKKEKIKKEIPVERNNLSPTILLSLDPDCVPAQLICRPSKHNKSPYVADIFVPSLNRNAICHVPNLDMGGKCVPGVELLVKPQKDKHGVLLGPNAVNPKYDTPKCEFVTQLLRCDESSLSTAYVPTWVGAHPSLGESIVKQLLDQRLFGDIMPPIASVSSQVTHTNMRADFCVEHTNGRTRIIEVKTVVDTDYSIHWPLPERSKCVFTSNATNYSRTALFPWGNSKQVGPDGETVVSARAIKHVMELTKLVEGGTHDATILFVVIRGDGERFRPNREACPSFAKHLKLAQDKGVQILVKRVKWGEASEDIGKCFDDGWIDIEWP